MAFVRKQGVRLVIYLDDILIINESREGALADLKLVVELFYDSTSPAYTPASVLKENISNHPPPTRPQAC